MRQRLRHGKRPMAGHTDDFLSADDGFPGAGMGPGLRGRALLQCSSACHELENGARRIGRVKEAVEIHAVIRACLVARDVGDVVGIVAGAGHGAQNFAGFVVIDAHCAVIAAERLQGCFLHLGTDGESCAGRALGCFVQAGNFIVADHLLGKIAQQRRADIAVAVAQQMDGRLAHGFIGTVHAAIRCIQDAHAGAVVNFAAGEIRAGIDVRTAGKRDPFFGVCRVFDAEGQRPHGKHNGQSQREQRAARYLFICTPPFRQDAARRRQGPPPQVPQQPPVRQAPPAAA